MAALTGWPTRRSVIDWAAWSALRLDALLVELSELDAQRGKLAQAGFEASVALVPGEPEEVLPAFVKAQGASLLVMGAYGHSRIRQLIVGSTTTMLLRLSAVPVLILR